MRQRAPDVHRVNSVFRRCTRCQWLYSVLRSVDRCWLLLRSTRRVIRALRERLLAERSSVPKDSTRNRFAIGNTPSFREARQILAQTNRLDDVIALAGRRESRVEISRNTRERDARKEEHECWMEFQSLLKMMTVARDIRCLDVSGSVSLLLFQWK